jgi:hypothetical protein
MVESKKFFCTDLAWEYGIPLVGTATRGDIWFLIEYTGSWGTEAFEESNILQKVKDHILTAQHPGIQYRTLLIRQDRTQLHNGLRFFVGQTHPHKPRLYEYQIQNYSDLLNIDISQLASARAGDPDHLRLNPLYLVCTNGKRDQCCSIYGPGVYKAMSEEAGDAVWQSSHIGGHNQAPIMLFFPHGVNYGHTTAAEARRLIINYQAGKVVLHHYRGRVCFEPHLQAAEHFWRAQTGNLYLKAVNIHNTVEIKKNLWKITVSDDQGQNKVQMRIQQRISDYEIPITCSQKKSAPVQSFHRID